MVKGVDIETLDGIDITWFKEVSQKLRNESFQFRPARRVYIPKPNGKLRPLGISSPRDKIIQQATRLVLEIILEPTFSDHSHGFRPSRGCHTALREIRNWSGVTWLIEGDIENFFPNIDHKILENLLNRHVKDQRFTNLYWKFVKAGYIEFKPQNEQTFVAGDKGVPQGGILSPLLSNLVLHELDKFVEDIMNKNEKNNVGLKPYKPSLKYSALSGRIRRLSKKIREMDFNQKREDSLKELKTLRKNCRKMKSTVPNEKYFSIKYVRYADDWVIGVWGSKAQAASLKAEIGKFLATLNLSLSEEKTLITNARSSRAKFLGVNIKRWASDKGTQKIVKGKRAGSGRIIMTAPMASLINKTIEKGLLLWRKNKNWRPMSMAKFIPLDDSDIILRFNTIIRGFLNYYSFVDNIKDFAKISYIVKENLCKTLIRKHKINRKILYYKYGKKISVIRRNSINIKKIWFYNPKLIKKPWNFLVSELYLNHRFDPFQAIKWKVCSKTNFDFPCAACGSDRTEMHHIKHIKTLNLKLNQFDSAMARVNRKQVPLCKPCHMKVHKGHYVGSPLKHWKPINRLIARPLTS